LTAYSGRGGQVSDQLICPCDVFVHPQTIVNPPGRNHVVYRVGDFVSFRHALLLSLPDEIELSNWKPSATDDLAVKMIEWWAYLSDILTFYNQRIAIQDYLRTGDLPESVRRLIQILGYRPRPGIGARGVVGALLNKQITTTIAKGFQIQSKPGPGKQPQIFEVDADAELLPPDAISADPAPDPLLIRADSSGRDSILLKGSVSTIKSGDEVLVIAKGWNASNDNYALG